MTPNATIIGFSVLPSMTAEDILDGMVGLLLQIRMGMMTLESWTVGERAAQALAGQALQETAVWLAAIKAGWCIYNGAPVHFDHESVQVTAKGAA